MSSLDLKKDLYNNPAQKSFSLKNPPSLSELVNNLEEELHEFSDDDFERASVADDELEWVEDDGLMRVVRNETNQLDYNEDSDDEAPN